MPKKNWHIKIKEGQLLVWCFYVSEAEKYSTVEKRLNTNSRLKREAYFNIAHLKDERQRTFTVQNDD